MDMHKHNFMQMQVSAQAWARVEARERRGGLGVLFCRPWKERALTKERQAVGSHWPATVPDGTETGILAAFLKKGRGQTRTVTNMLGIKKMK